MKPFMSEATKRKINLFGSDYKEAIKEAVDVDTFPKYWGGNKVDDNGDPRCLFPAGGKVPESYYLRGEDIVGDAEVTTITVGRGSHHDVTFTVSDNNKVLRWAFWSIHYDIKYGVFYREKEGEKKVAVKPMERINAHQVPVDGWIKCDKPGIYFVRFDNEYSWVHSKELHHAIQLVDTELKMDAIDEEALQPLETIMAQSSPEPMVYTPLFSNLNLDDIQFIDDEDDDDEEEYADAETEQAKS